MANRFAGGDIYETILASEDGGEIVCNSGLHLGPAVKLCDLPRNVDTILIAGGGYGAVCAARESGLPEWIIARRQATRRIGSVCSGAFVLAATGFLDGRRAATHWAFCNELKSYRPSVRVEPDAIYVLDEPFYTSAGVTAGIDLCLAMVESDCGAELSLAVARNLVLFMRRAGGQAQFSPALAIPAFSGRARLDTLIADVVGDPGREWRLPYMAAKVGMSERNFSRVFKKKTGLTPAAFVDAARADRAKLLLETSDCTLARIAELSGFGSIHGLHRAFQRRLGVTPGEYRSRFGMRVGGRPYVS